MKVTIEISANEATELRALAADLEEYRYGVPLQELRNIIAVRVAAALTEGDN